MEKLVNNGKILEVRTGSHLYGLATSTSDKDYTGIFLTPWEYHIGLQKLEQVDLGVESKLENGKNSSEAVDRTFYELKRFVALAAGNNPNIIELLFVDEDNIIYINKYGRKLLENRHLFLSQKLIEKFSGFANSQKHKLYVKKENLEKLYSARDFIKEMIEKYKSDKILLPEMSKEKNFWKNFIQRDAKGDVYRIGEYNINSNLNLKNACELIERIIKESSNRQELIRLSGYDTKYASHLVRLLLEAIEIITTGNLVYPLQEKDLIMKIKKGEMKFEEVIELVEELEKRFKSFENTPELIVIPEKADIKAIEKFVIEIYKDFLLKGE